MLVLVMLQVISAKRLRLFLNVILANIPHHILTSHLVKVFCLLVLNAHTVVKTVGSLLLKQILLNIQMAMYLLISMETNSITFLMMKANIFLLTVKNLKLKKEPFLKPITHTWFPMVSLIVTSMKTENLQLLRTITMLRHILGQRTMSISQMKQVIRIS